jgi:hypothetical protein
MFAQDPLSTLKDVGTLQQSGYQEILWGKLFSRDRVSIFLGNEHDGEAPNQLDHIPVPELSTRRRVKCDDIGSPLYCDGFVAGVLQSCFRFESWIILDQN